jgi:putative phosphotransacetylase
MTPGDANALGIREDEFLKVHFRGERALTLENVRPKISEDYVLQMHLDTDDANAAGLQGGEPVEIVRDAG